MAESILARVDRAMICGSSHGCWGLADLVGDRFRGATAEVVVQELERLRAQGVDPAPRGTRAVVMVGLQMLPPMWARDLVIDAGYSEPAIEVILLTRIARVVRDAVRFDALPREIRFRAAAGGYIVLDRAHRLEHGQGPVQVRGVEGESLPMGLAEGTVYWVIAQNIAALHLASTERNARDGLAIPLTTSGGGILVLP